LLLLLLLRELLDTTFTLAAVDTEQTGLEEVTETVNIGDTIVEGATVVTVRDDVEFVVVTVVDVVVVIVADSWDCSEAVDIVDAEVVVETDEFGVTVLDVVVELVVVLVELDVNIVVVVVIVVLVEAALAVLVFEALLLGCSCFCCCSLCNRVVTPVGPLRTSARLF